jgi:hypothetical protein
VRIGARRLSHAHCKEQQAIGAQPVLLELGAGTPPTSLPASSRRPGTRILRAGAPIELAARWTIGVASKYGIIVKPADGPLIVLDQLWPLVRPNAPSFDSRLIRSAPAA